MKRRLEKIAERIDAFSLRERVMIFLAAAVATAAVLEVMLLQPRLSEERRLSAELSKRQGDMRELQARILKLAVSRQADPDRELRLRLKDAQDRLSALEGRIAEEQRKFTTPEQMRGMLEEILARSGKLRLVDLRTLPPATIAGAKPSPAEKGVARPAAKEQQVFRHGVELTVSGTYLDLLGYLGELERLPTQMYWGALNLKVERHPAVTLKLTVYTLSIDKSWIRV